MCEFGLVFVFLRRPVLLAVIFIARFVVPADARASELDALCDEIRIFNPVASEKVRNNVNDEESNAQCGSSNLFVARQQTRVDANLDITGAIIASCPHLIPFWLINMYLGEKYVSRHCCS